MRAILTYHSVDPSGSPISISEVSFRRHVEWLATKGPRVVGVEEMLTLPPTEAAIALTFDDALVNFATIAWPLLRTHALPVTLFVPTDRVGDVNAWDRHDPSIPRLPILGWDALARLMDEGVTLGSHTRTHARLSQLAPEFGRVEIEQSAARIEAMTGKRPAGLAYPYGAYDDRVVQAVATRYAYAVTTDMRQLRVREDAHRLPRIDTYYLRSPGSLESWDTSKFRFYLRARAGARACRRLLRAGS
jgi:peptidoglycan/xylan/chitin deacetylase (PgdA/CDA1 family)